MKTKQAKSYRCHLAILKEEDGGCSVLVLNLPGAGSCGDSEEQAIANVREAIAGVVASYLDEDEDVPWRDSTTYSIPAGAKQKWIRVNA